MYKHLQADLINGIYEVKDFDDLTDIVSETDFLHLLKNESGIDLGKILPIGCTVRDKRIYEALDSEFGIK